MCAYNKLNGHHACASDELLETDLRDRMAFPRFCRFRLGGGASIPCWPGRGDARVGCRRLGRPSGAGILLKDLVIWMRRLWMRTSRESCAPAAAVPGFWTRAVVCLAPAREELCATNATSGEHRALARDFAADSVVMLKNEKTLPFTQPKRSPSSAARARRSTTPRRS